MTTEESFLEDIRDNPDDDGVRLVFADWLEDRNQSGDEDRAEFIRLQIDIARSSPQRQESEPMARAKQILERHYDRWTAPIWKILGSFIVSSAPILQFRRGFIDELTLDTEIFLAHGLRLVACAPIRRMRLLQGGGHGRALANCPALSRLRELDLVDYYREPLRGTDMVPLSHSQYLNKLTALRLQRNNLGDIGVEALARAAWLTGLLALDLTDNGLSSSGLTALLNTTHRFRPWWMSLTYNDLSNLRAASLATSAVLTELQWLDLSRCDVGIDTITALAGCELPTLRHLDLSSNHVNDAFARRLARAPWLSTLTRLILRGNTLSHEGLALLSPHLEGVHLVLG